MQHAVEKPSKYEFLWEENVNSANWKCLGSDHNNSEQQQGHFSPNGRGKEIIFTLFYKGLTPLNPE